MQTSYDLAPAIAQEGQLADISPRSVGSYLAEEALTFGRVVVQGDEDNTCKLATEDGHVVGITAYSAFREAGDPQATDMVNVLTKGAIYVRPETAVKPGDPVFYRHAGEDAGRLRNDADTDKATELAGARWRTSADAEGLAILEINLP